jgi:hypothetical protein
MLSPRRHGEKARETKAKSIALIFAVSPRRRVAVVNAF